VTTNSARNNQRPWKLAAAGIVFIVSFAPYVLNLMFIGIEDVLYFLLIWLVSLLFIRAHPVASLAVSVLGGVALAIPASSFVTFANGHAIFFTEGARDIVHARFATSFRIGFFTALMLAAHFLLKPSRVAK